MLHQAQEKRFLIALAFTLSTLAAGKTSMQDLPAAKIEAMKKLPCTFIHVWATWCSICVQEMPDVIKMLSGMKKVNPVIVDVSTQMVQKEFSRPWMKKLAPPFPVYFKPAGGDEAYLNAIDKDWGGALPYSALHDKGVLKKAWVGEAQLKTLQAELAALCP